ncbi:DUF1320 family protein [Thermomonas sp. S9]|uniref:phage protein Gp36 family protein n=1 Tax=Thermomonas sp. S9 TaxID=2885203 RepID=UPI00216B06EC|nr:phage protein Gp36 family protein [Thermomonas sp. S9]MCR6494794.1 DUF1320 family protein [Thermomonas sp. S9]
MPPWPSVRLDDAQAEIDGYIASRYKLPLPTVPAALARIACDVARYRLWEDVASDDVRRATRMRASCWRRSPRAS